MTKKILYLVSTFFLIPIICAASISGPTYDGAWREKYHISAKNEWRAENNLNIALDYEHYSQRAANTSFFNYHVDGEKYIFKITGLGQINIKDLKKTLEYQSNNKKGYISVNNDYSQAIDFTDAIAYDNSTDTLTIHAYTFGREIDDVQKIMIQGNPISFYLSYKNGTKIEIQLPSEVVTEIIEARKYIFNKENKESLRAEYDKKLEEDKQKKTEILLLLNKTPITYFDTTFLKYDGGPKKLTYFGNDISETYKYKYLGRSSENNLDIYYLKTEKKNKLYILVLLEGETEINQALVRGEFVFNKKKNTVLIKDSEVTTSEIEILNDSVLSKFQEMLLK